MDTIKVADAKGMLIYVADRIIQNKGYLTDIDSAIGDGDHGIGMAGGMERVKEKLNAMEDADNVYQIFETAGRVMLMSMGGASGVIFGSLYMAGAKNMEPKAELTVKDFVEMQKKSLLAIKLRGKAKLGDKTMVDAFEPAVAAMEEYEEADLLTVLTKAEEKAREGMEKTKDYQAKYGRAKSLMERAIGYQDAGATSVWIILKSMREYVEAYQVI